MGDEYLRLMILRERGLLLLGGSRNPLLLIATTSISRAGHWRKKDRDFLFNLCHYDDRAMDAVRTVRKTKTRVPKLKSIINELVGDDDFMNPRCKSDLFAFPPPSLLQVRGHFIIHCFRQDFGGSQW